jgi:glutathione S-transferase
MSNYPCLPVPEGMEPLATDYVRATANWHDRLVLAALQTFSASMTMSQLQWSGVRHEENGDATRCASRNQHLPDWLEAQLSSSAVTAHSSPV